MQPCLSRREKYRAVYGKELDWCRGRERRSKRRLFQIEGPTIEYKSFCIRWQHEHVMPVVYHKGTSV